MESTKPKEGDLKVWWKPQIPCASFEVPVESPQQAKLLLRVLADYDLFQLKNRIKPDYSNAGGLVVFEGGDDPGWVDWYDEDGNDIDHQED